MTEMHPISRIPEILEPILLEVPALELIIVCRTVCHLWKSLIETSPLLIGYTKTGIHQAAHHEPVDLTKGNNEVVLTPLARKVVEKFWRKIITRTTSDPHYNRSELPSQKLLIPIFSEVRAQFGFISKFVTLLNPFYTPRIPGLAVIWAVHKQLGSQKYVERFFFDIVAELGGSYEPHGMSVSPILDSLCKDMLQSVPLLYEDLKPKHRFRLPLMDKRKQKKKEEEVHVPRFVAYEFDGIITGGARLPKSLVSLWFRWDEPFQKLVVAYTAAT